MQLNQKPQLLAMSWRQRETETKAYQPSYNLSRITRLSCPSACLFLPFEILN